MEGTSASSDSAQVLGSLETTAEDIFGTNSLTDTNVSTGNGNFHATSGSALPTAPPSATSTPQLATTPGPPGGQPATATPLKNNVIKTASVSQQQQPQQQNSFILSPQPVMTMAPGAILTSTPTVIQQGGIQYTLQPAASSNPTSVSTAVVNGVPGVPQAAKSAAQKSKGQPQLLPKPSSASAVPTASTVSITTAGVVVTSSSGISTVVSANAQPQRPVVTMATVSAPAAQVGSTQQYVLNTGGVIAGASTAPLLLTGNNFFFINSTFAI